MLVSAASAVSCPVRDCKRSVALPIMEVTLMTEIMSRAQRTPRPNHAEAAWMAWMSGRIVADAPAARRALGD